MTLLPVILAVDDDPNELRRVQDELSARYGRSQSVRCTIIFNESAPAPEVRIPGGGR
jgi:hypothetical protein